MTFTNRSILITGGNSGIGLALAEALQSKGNRIIITARNRDSLQAVLQRNPEMAGYRLDVTDESSLAAFSDAHSPCGSAAAPSSNPTACGAANCIFGAGLRAQGR